MSPNEGYLDRSVRLIAGIALILAWLQAWIPGTLGLVLGLVGAVLIITGFVGVCPIYKVLGMSTRNEV